MSKMVKCPLPWILVTCQFILCGFTVSHVGAETTSASQLKLGAEYDVAISISIPPGSGAPEQSVKMTGELTFNNPAEGGLAPVKLLPFQFRLTDIAMTSQGEEMLAEDRAKLLQDPKLRVGGKLLCDEQGILGFYDCTGDVSLVSLLRRSLRLRFTERPTKRWVVSAPSYRKADGPLMTHVLDASSSQDEESIVIRLEGERTIELEKDEGEIFTIAEEMRCWVNSTTRTLERIEYHCSRVRTRGEEVILRVDEQVELKLASPGPKL